MNDELLYYLGFSHFYGIGPVRFSALLKRYGTAEKAYFAPEKELREIFGTSLSEKFIKFRNRFDPGKKLLELKNKNIEVLAIYSKKYPRALMKISDPPICIYCKGDPGIFNEKGILFFSIVGSRFPTDYGFSQARIFSRDLTESGFSIISGMAYGIDAAAHKACLDAGGKTVAVLGCGVDIVYPAGNRQLYNRIINGKGAVISEFPPGQLVAKGLFIARNRIISGLSKGILVVEGTKMSGSLISAKYAAEQGKEVFALPCPVNSRMSEAPNFLIKTGAVPALSAGDILDEFNMKYVRRDESDILKNLNASETEVFKILKRKPQPADELSLTLRKPVNYVLNILSVLEISGIIEKNEQNNYQIRLSCQS